METITQPRAEKRGWWASVQRALAKVWNTCLPDVISIHWVIQFGRYGVHPIALLTDHDGWGGWSLNPSKTYLPEISLFEIEKHGACITDFRRRLIGYMLVVTWDTPEYDEDDDDDEEAEKEETEYWYWHRFSILFFDFYFETDGPIKLKWEP